MKDWIYGIDLGTTFSSVAGIDESGRCMVYDDDGRTSTPSVVWFDGESSAVVGTEAKRMLSIDTENVIRFAKRSMGTDAALGPHHLRAETVSAIILRKLACIVKERQHIDIKRAVISCPAYFGHNEREATRKAGELAGFEEVFIINEPSAAAIAYGMENAEKEKNVLVYDLGGGTFDVTLMKVSPGEIRVVATGGNPRLGGADWDAALASLLIDRFAEQTDLDAAVLRRDIVFKASAEQEANQAKERLSRLETTKVALRYDGKSADFEVTREEFESITETLLNKTGTSITDVLESAKEKTGAAVTPDTILLVGGSSNMPQVKRSVETRFPGIEVKLFRPEEAVARGAALYGQTLMVREVVLDDTGIDIALSGRSDSDRGNPFGDISLSGRTNTAEEISLSGRAQAEIVSLTGRQFNQRIVIRVINVASKTYGSGCQVDGENGRKEQKVCNIIFRNTELPVTKTEHFQTPVDNCTGVRCTTYESSASSERDEKYIDPDDGRLLYTGSLSGLPPGRPKGQPLEDIYTLDEEGVLKVSCKDINTGITHDYVVQTTNVISDEEFQKAKRYLNGLSVE